MGAGDAARRSAAALQRRRVETPAKTAQRERRSYFNLSPRELKSINQSLKDKQGSSTECRLVRASSNTSASRGGTCFQEAVFTIRRNTKCVVVVFFSPTQCKIHSPSRHRDREFSANVMTARQGISHNLISYLKALQLKFKGPSAKSTERLQTIICE